MVSVVVDSQMRKRSINNAEGDKMEWWVMLPDNHAPNAQLVPRSLIRFVEERPADVAGAVA